MSKSMYNVLLGMAAMGMMMSSPGVHNWMEVTPEQVELIKRRYQRKRDEILKERGLKEFVIDGISVLALNEKNAVRKVNNFKKKNNL